MADQLFPDGPSDTGRHPEDPPLLGDAAMLDALATCAPSALIHQQPLIHQPAAGRPDDRPTPHCFSLAARPPPPTGHLIRALRCRLGAEPEVELTEEERTTLLTQGFLNLGQLISPEQCEEAKRRILAQVRSEKPSEWSVRTGDISLSNVLNKCNDDGLFDVAITHPKLLAAMRLTLGDSFRLFSLKV